MESDNLCTICNEEFSNVEKHIIQKHIRQIRTVQKGTEKYNMYKCPLCKKYFKKGDLNHAHDESKNLSNTPDKNDDKEPEVHKQLTGTGSDFEQRPTDMENNIGPIVITNEPINLPENLRIEKNSEIIINNYNENRKRKSSELIEGINWGTKQGKQILVNVNAEKNNSNIKIRSPFDHNSVSAISGCTIPMRKSNLCTVHGCKAHFKSYDNLKLHLKNIHGIHFFDCVSKSNSDNPIKFYIIKSLSK